MKKLLCIILALIVVSCTAVFAEEAPSFSQKAESDTATLSSELPQHNVPTNLRWNINKAGEAQTCAISWESVPETNDRYMVKLWCNDELIINTSYSTNAHEETNLVDFGSLNIYFSKSGTYKFAVASRGDNKNYADSEYVESEEFEYVVPEKKAPSVTNVKWDKNGTLSHNGVEGVYGFHYVEYYTAEGSDELIPTGGSSGIGGNTSNVQQDDCSNDILQTVNRFDKVTAYYLAIYTIPTDLSEYTYSDPVISPAYDVLHLRNYAGEGVKDIIGSNYDPTNSDADDTKKEILDYMSKKNLAATELALAMTDDYNVENAIFNLEIDYMNENGIRTEVSDTSDGYVEGLGIDASEIVVKGAALNAAGNDGTVTLSISNPSTERNPPTAFFDNCSVFSLELTGVSDSTSLDIPVMIYLPVPESYDVWSTLILHYKKDGTYEVLHGNPQNMNGSQYLAFCVTGFSDFVLCTGNPENDLNYDGITNTKDVQHYLGEIINGITNGYFGGNMSGSLDLNSDGKFNLADLNYFMNLIRNNI